MVSAAPGAAIPQRLAAGRIRELDGLRGVAILLVLLYHVTAYVSEFVVRLPGPIPRGVVAVALQGYTGVDLFFVLSGFLIGGILVDSRKSPRYFKAFYIRRFFRIVPLYWAIVAFSLVVITGAIPYYSESNTHSDVPWYAFLSFTQNFWEATGRLAIVPFMGVTWSLAVEEQFYLTMPWLIRFAKDKYLPVCLLGIIALAPVTRLVLYEMLTGDARISAPYAFTLCRTDGLGLGVLAAVLLRKPRVWAAAISHRRALYAILAALAPGAGYLLFAPESALQTAVASTWIALLFLCVLVIAVTHETSIISRLLRNPSLIGAGVLAYGLYLVHSICITFFESLLSAYVPFGGRMEVVAVGVSIVATFALAKLSWKYFERPLINFGRAYHY